VTPYKALNIKIRQLLKSYERGELSTTEYEVMLKRLYEEHISIEKDDQIESENDLLNYILLSED